MPNLSYEWLITHFGESLACWCLTEIEKAAGIIPRTADIDHEGRLAAALQAQDAALAVSAAA